MMFIPLKAATSCFNVLSEIPLKQKQNKGTKCHDGKLHVIFLLIPSPDRNKNRNIFIVNAALAMIKSKIVFAL